MFFRSSNAVVAESMVSTEKSPVQFQEHLTDLQETGFVVYVEDQKSTRHNISLSVW